MSYVPSFSISNIRIPSSSKFILPPTVNPPTDWTPRLISANDLMLDRLIRKQCRVLFIDQHAFSSYYHHHHHPHSSPTYHHHHININWKMAYPFLLDIVLTTTISISCSKFNIQNLIILTPTLPLPVILLVIHSTCSGSMLWYNTIF